MMSHFQSGEPRLARQAKVGIILLNWNGFRDTSVCVSSLRELRYPDYDITIVDNDSTDGSVSHLRTEFPEVRVIETGRNLGFAGGCNVGIRHALRQDADFIWLLNNDTTVDPNSLQAQVDKARSAPDIGVCGSAIYCVDHPRRLQAWGGGHINFWLGRSRHYLRPVRDDSIEFITGASMLIAREAIESIGFLDDGFFMYWEDADYCFRLRDAGWRLAVAGQSRVWHKGSSSVGKASAKLDRYFNASAARFFEKHARAPLIPRWTGVTLRIGKRLIARDWERARAVWAGSTGS